MVFVKQNIDTFKKTVADAINQNFDNWPHIMFLLSE